MPKREKTPPPPDDEPKYLTVVHPYPPHANMELLSDQKEFSYWIASCIGKDVFLAFFYKPASPNMIIIEITRGFQYWDLLLGEHRWSEVLQNPSAEQKDRVSQVFYCTFHTGRQVQKYGWKRVNVEEKWFTDWSPVNKIICYPYPATYWCPVPVEDATNTPLCRNLPVKDFPQPPPNLRLPPVGAEGWQTARKATSTAWSKGPPPLKMWDLNEPSEKPSAKSPPSATSPNRGGARPSAWGNGLSSTIASPAPIYGPPPGLPPLGGYIASTPSGSYHTAPSTAWTVTSASSRASSSAGSRPTSDGGSIGGTPTPSEIHGVESMTPPPDIETAMGEELDVDDSEWETAADDRGPYETPAESAEDPNEDLWATWKPAEPAKPKDDVICQEHGPLCKKGICRVYKRQLREAERKKQEEERATASEKKKTNKKTRTKPQYVQKPQYVEKPPNLRPRAVPPAPRSEVESEVTSETQSEAQTEEKPPTEESPERATSQKINFKDRPQPPHLAHADSSDTKDEDASASPTSPSSAADDAPRTPPAATTRARPAHLMKGKPTAPAPAPRASSTSSGSQGAGPSAKATPSNDGWGRVPRNSASIKSGAKSVVSSNGGWGNVSNGPWGSGSVNGSARQAKGKAKTPQAVPDGGPKKSWADQMEEDDARSVAESSTGGWGTISNGPW